MFGAEHRIIDGYGCDKCRSGPTGGQCCREPIRYWTHTTEAGRELCLASWPTELTPRWCERHQLATDGRSCWVCLFGPIDAFSLPYGDPCRLPLDERRKPRCVTEYRVLIAEGCHACRTCATDGQCCERPIRYTCGTTIVDGKSVDYDVTPWPTTGTPYWCDVHLRACSLDRCLLCDAAQLARAERMRELTEDHNTGSPVHHTEALERPEKRRKGMHSSRDGILVTQPELRALLAFASREQTDRDKYGVKFVATAKACFARASNGRICIQGHGEAGDLAGEWFVHKDFLSASYKLMTSKRAVLLEFSGGSLHFASIQENGAEIERLEWQGEGAAIAQTEFPKVEKDIKLPKKTRKPAHCVAVCAEYLPVLDTVAKAAGVDFVDLYPPEDPQTQLVFQAGGDDSTTWTGAIWPTPSKNSTSRGDEDEAAEAAE